MKLDLRSLFLLFLFLIMYDNGLCQNNVVDTEAWKFKAFQNVSVLPMDEIRMLENQTVLVENDRIAAIGPVGLIDIPDNTYIVDGTNKVLLPGLVDSHIHLRHTDTTGLVSYLEAGITTAREMNGRPFLLDWRKRIKEGSLLGPTLYVASPTIGNFSSPREGYPTPTTAAQADSTIRRFAQQGYDWIKVYSFVPGDIFSAIIDAANKYGIPVGGHPPIEVSFEESLRMKSIEHLLGYLEPIMTDEARRLDEEDLRGVFHAVNFEKERLPDLAQRTKLAGVWNCPTVLFFDHRVPTERVRKAWEKTELRKLGHNNRLAIVQALHEAGAKLVVGTDSDAGDDLPAEAIHEEMANMVDAGLTPYEVLVAATKGAAEFLNGQSEFGTVSVGKRADLLMVNCNPLEDISCLKQRIAVMSRGNLILFENRD